MYKDSVRETTEILLKKELQRAGKFKIILHNFEYYLYGFPCFQEKTRNFKMISIILYLDSFPYLCNLFINYKHVFLVEK